MAPISALWRRLDEPHGLVHGAISELEPTPDHPDGAFLLDGAAIGTDAGEDTGPIGEQEAPRPWSTRFSVVVDSRWQTRSCFVEVLGADGLDRVTLTADALGHWTLDGRDWADLEGCVDVDVSISPLTNTLVVARLGLDVGEERSVDVAWLDVPSLAVARVTQTYRREPDDDAGQRYVYADPTYGSFLFTVDPRGIVREYQGLFARVA
ncbi:putative glycolipid-binding domain-containing protein [Actinomycetospora sp. TBRC 11914]|uniref:putative glycolipid-binding domain-containing protein n=1 Tax=Actinomycetospora sp. TBRC 11914 TaxID=2729387 RepID=UPI00145E6267|nr:putative glycolipid-binding domain-containing protein [Actinomycetospora sp. TBRC 11914]NMO92779.1 putative glycolipid-binding domain-containing protein [Actinomycetospora sp. TBRC 11914]